MARSLILGGQKHWNSVQRIKLDKCPDRCHTDRHQWEPLPLLLLHNGGAVALLRLERVVAGQFPLASMQYLLGCNSPAVNG